MFVDLLILAGITLLLHFVVTICIRKSLLGAPAITGPLGTVFLLVAIGIANFWMAVAIFCFIVLPIIMAIRYSLNPMTIPK
jgi:hypothetical protein